LTGWTTFVCGLTLSRWDHKVLSDFVPTRGSAQFIARPLVTAGYAGDLVADSARLVPYTVATKTMDDLSSTVTGRREKELDDSRPSIRFPYGAHRNRRDWRRRLR
jgi:hypothetical protein